MILGVPANLLWVLVGGILVLTLTVFEVLLGLRIIKLGKRHRTVHRWVAFSILGVAVVHGLLALAYVTGVLV